MNAKISVFVIYVEAIKFLLYILHDCTFKVLRDLQSERKYSQ